MFSFFNFNSNKKLIEELFEYSDQGNLQKFQELFLELEKKGYTIEQIFTLKDKNDWSLLQLVSIKGHYQIVQEIIRKCENNNQNNNSNNSNDNKNNNNELLQKVLEYEGQSKHTSLLLSLTNGFEEISCLLLEKNALINGITSKNRNCMYLVARNGFIKAANIMLERYGSNKIRELAEVIDSNGYNSLHAAALMGQAQICSFLVNTPIQIPLTPCTRDGSNAFHLACRLSSNQNSGEVSSETLQSLFNSDQLIIHTSSILNNDNIESKSNNDNNNNNNDNNNKEISVLLLKILHTADCFGSTPLHIACLNLNIHAIQTILTNVSNINHLITQDNDGYHPIHLLCHEFMRCITELKHLNESQTKEIDEMKNKIDISINSLKCLIQAKYPLNVCDYNQMTIFHSLTNCDSFTYLKELFDFFDTIDITNNNYGYISWRDIVYTLEDCTGWTSLHFAYHKDVKKYSTIIESYSDEIKNNENLLNDYFIYFYSNSSEEFRRSFDPNKIRNNEALKLAKTRCGAHNRIPIEERKSILNLNYTIQGVVDYLNNISQTRKPRIVVLCGAGISTSAGIKDFRSEDGLYSQKSTQKLFSLEFLIENSSEFYNQVNQMFLPVVDGRIKPTPTHILLKLFESKGWLTRIYTQNVDMLEHQVIQDHNLIVECHGSFKRAYCFNTQCSSPVYLKTTSEMNQLYWNKIRNNESPICPNCSSILRPDVTFFGEPLPTQFGQNSMNDLPSCDLLLVMGTSLVVYPVASLPSMVSNSAVRMLINREPTGCFQFVKSRNIDNNNNNDNNNESLNKKQVETSSYRDVFYKGSCDDGSREFAHYLNLDNEFNQLVSSICRVE